MQGRDNIISFGGGTARRYSNMLDAKGQRVVADSRKLISTTFTQLMTGLFEQLDDSLYELADKSLNDAVQTSYFDAMRLLRKERLHIDREFNRQVLEAFDSYWATGRVDTVQHSLDELSRDSEMAILDNDELEDSLAITNMISKSENRYARERYALSQRFAYLLAGERHEPTANEQNPIDPAVICNAFQAAMREVAVELTARLVVYKLFEKHVIYYLGGLYDEINLLLGKAGIIPKLTPKVRRNPIAPAVQSGNRLGGEQTPGDSRLTGDNAYVDTASVAMDAVQGEVFATLQQLLNLRRGVAGGGMHSSSMIYSGVPNGQVDAVDTGELLGALSLLQQSNVLVMPQAGGQVINPKQLRAQLLEDLQLQEGGETCRTLAEADNDTIDVISMLFEFILEDFSLPDAMKALLSRLQIPMLKVAIIDKTFFSQKGHPARRLLNTLAQAAVGWNDTGDRENDSLYRKIESVIKCILNDFHDTPDFFQKLDQDFSAWWEQEQKGAVVAEQRTNQVTRGKEQLRSAKQVVVDELNNRLQRLAVIPEAVMELLEDGWKDVLLLNYLRQGQESEEWIESLEIVDRLLWSVQPKSEYAERQELLRSIPELLRNLRERLNSISFDQHKMARLFKELQNCHIGCLRGGDSTAAKGAGTAPAKQQQIHFPDSQLVSGHASYRPEEPETDEQQNDRYTRRTDSLEVGSWLEITDGTTKTRVKLSWKSNVTDAYIFVNRKGIKAMELTRQGLAKRLREGNATLVDIPKGQLMDRALDAMLSALKNTDQTTSPA